MSALPSLRQLRYLVAVSDKLNFTQAAESCFVTQSTLSAGIKELEATLGTRLVERERHSVMMTAVGAEVVVRARRLLAEAEDLTEWARNAERPMSGLLRLGVIPTIAPFLLPAVLPEVRSRYPELKLALREDLTANLLARLATGQIDFALIALPYDTGNLQVHPLFDEELLLIAPAGREADMPRDIGKLDPEALLLLEEGHCLRGHTLGGCRLDEPRVTGMEATSLFTLAQMVEGGLGMALLPDMTLRSGLLGHMNLVAHRFSEPRPRRTIALVARSSNARQECFARLAELIAGQAPQSRTDTTDGTGT
ncbi:MAG: LysR substrate-binding domain-containing protein [Methyloversatilis sp.]|uniref:hydrogen peroxide-inducible genes activator n=1 Tax=Methyloversatilis sp. TaxID=2569862 RepID=UPI0025FDA11F|nr:hydrogen peroxide-inducible genes activator [Methyloversatilis sp.]MCR6665145.1 LysR substrate-binding domain-containing protein [Methyloversatilis sp.]